MLRKSIVTHSSYRHRVERCYRIMSDEQRNLISLAKLSAQRHLATILSNPDLYVATFRYGMDFVWGTFFVLIFSGLY